MASTFLTVASCCTCAPLRPSYNEKDFEFYLNDINAKALIIKKSFETVARKVAEKLDIKIIELVPSSNSAGKFQLKHSITTKDINPVFSGQDDTALVLHTSGTTARPKIVPLTQVNLCTSARNIMNTLHLKQSDKCLNIMPLFHIHGLIGAVLSSISAGARIICTEGFNVNSFFDLLFEQEPTWYTAVPTMHHSILSKARRDGVQKTSLRFIRSSSQALPPIVMKGLETVFQAPVIESYGMTEASHQMASNLLPPLTRKPGSVGKAAGPEISIMNEEGKLIRGPGEIVIRGSSVTLGYENNQEANDRSFKDGWFRTGDEGYLDSDDYLYVTGRIKEIINRGGEKISPREIDEALLELPEITEALAFAVPHERLGETVGVAIVLEKNTTLSKWDIQKYVSENLGDYKVPEEIVFLDEIPKGATGKVQRIGLADKLGITEKTEVDSPSETTLKPPSNVVEQQIHDIWSEVLRIPEIGVNQNYFQLGGDSVLATSIITQMMEKMGYKEISMVIFLHAPTIEQMAALVQKEEFTQAVEAFVVRLRTGTGKPVFFLNPTMGGLDQVRQFITSLRVSNPIYVIRTDVIDKEQDSIEGLIFKYLREISALFPTKQIIISGIDLGCLIGYEMARELTNIGRNPVLLMIDPYKPTKDLKERMKISGLLRSIFDSKHRSQYNARQWMLQIAKGYKIKTYNGTVYSFIPSDREWIVNQEKKFANEASSITGQYLTKSLAEKLEETISKHSGE
jgi:acyl-CoA synthetase (AMP-forming)/AMP-acid ligase II